MEGEGLLSGSATHAFGLGSGVVAGLAFRV